MATIPKTDDEVSVTRVTFPKYLMLTQPHINNFINSIKASCVRCACVECVCRSILWSFACLAIFANFSWHRRIRRKNAGKKMPVVMGRDWIHRMSSSCLIDRVWHHRGVSEKYIDILCVHELQSNSALGIARALFFLALPPDSAESFNFQFIFHFLDQLYSGRWTSDGIFDA